MLGIHIPYTGVLHTLGLHVGAEYLLPILCNYVKTRVVCSSVYGSSARAVLYALTSPQPSTTSGQRTACKPQR